MAFVVSCRWKKDISKIINKVAYVVVTSKRQATRMSDSRVSS